ncbi:hypothetical protein [Mesorhizobium sp. B263B2A]|nr:hypothetical protein [Mesorhizobium sp. B263B2A]
MPLAVDANLFQIRLPPGTAPMILIGQAAFALSMAAGFVARVPW